MSRLTATEKEHWKTRIEHRINRAIESLQLKDVALMPTIKAKADLQAHKFLGTDALHTRIEAIRKQIKALDEEQDRLDSEMYSIALGKLDCTQSRYSIKSDFWSMHRKSQERFEDELMKDSPIGREILKLREEKESLLDTVWLATSSTQIRDLWSRVSSVVGDDATPLQQQILAVGAESTETD